MKNAIIAALLIVIALMATSARDRGGTQAMIEDVSAHHAAWSPAPVMLFAPCPLAPRNFPRLQERKA